MGIYIGTSGWSYDHWNGVLYPHGLESWKRISYYTQQFQTVELNSSFYRWPATSSFKNWNSSLPKDFMLSVKAPSLLTHVKRLYAPESWIDHIKLCWHALRNRRAVLLVQLSPNFQVDYGRLQYFLQQVPGWMKIAVEFRHHSWHTEDIFTLLEHYGAAYCIMSGAHLPCTLRSTATFVYVRMHGPSHHHLYAGSYTNNDLCWWAQRIEEWRRQQKDVYVYFNNDGEGNAVNNAHSLKALCYQI